MANPNDPILGTSIEINAAGATSDIANAMQVGGSVSASDVEALADEQSGREAASLDGDPVSPSPSKGRKRSADVMAREALRTQRQQEFLRAARERADREMLRTQIVRDRIAASAAPADSPAEVAGVVDRITPSFEQAAGIAFQEPDFSGYNPAFTPSRSDAEYRAEEEARQKEYWSRAQSERRGVSRRIESLAEETRSPMQIWRDMHADVRADVENIFAASGKGWEVQNRSAGFQSALKEAYAARGIAMPEEEPQGRAGGIAGIRGMLTDPNAKFALGFGLMQAGAAAGQAYANTNTGNYVTPEQQASAYAGVLPGVLGTIGAIGGAAIPGIGPIVGSLAGAGVGSLAQSGVSSYEDQSQASRQAAESLAAALGQATSKVGEFRDAIASTGAPVKDFGAVLASALSVGNPGTGSVAGLGSITNALGEYAVGDIATTSKYIAGNPQLYRIGQRLASGEYASGDATSLAFDAAEQGDYGSLRTFQRDESRLRLKDNSRYQAAQARMRSGYNPLQLGGIAGAAYRFLSGYSESRSLEDNPPPDPNAIAENALAAQMSEIRDRAISTKASAQVAGGNLAQVVGRGGSLGDIASAAAGYQSSLRTAASDTDARIALLTADLSNPVNAGRRSEIQTRIDQARAEGNSYTTAEIASRRSMFDIVTGTQEGGYAVDQARGQYDLTRALLGGQSYRDAAGIQQNITAGMRNIAGYHEGLANDLSNPLLPQERQEELAKAIAGRTAADASDYGYRMRDFGQRIGALDNSIGASQFGVQQATLYAGPGAYDAAFSREADAYKAKIAELSDELKNGGLNYDDAIAKQGELNQAIAASARIASDSARAYYGAVGSIEASAVSGSHANAGMAAMAGGSGAAIGDVQSSIRGIGDQIETARQRSMDPRLGEVENKRAAAEMKQLQFEQMREIGSGAQYTPTPGQQVDETRLRGALNRGSYSFLEVGNLNEMRGKLFGVIGQEQRDYEAQIHRMYGDNIPDYVKPAVAAQEERFKDERARIGYQMDVDFFKKLPSMSIGQPSFAQRYLPTPSQAAAYTERVAPTLSAYNFGFFQSETFDAAHGEVGGLLSAGKSNAELQPGNQTVQALAHILQALPALIEHAVESGASKARLNVDGKFIPSHGSVQTNNARTSGLGPGMPGVGSR